MARLAGLPTVVGMALGIRRIATLGGPFTRPLSGRRLFPLWGVVHHAGRRSGRAYATPVVTRRIPDGFVIPLPFGERTDWYRNLLAAGVGHVQWKGATYAIGAPVVVDRTQAADAFNGIQRSLLRLSGIDRFVVVREAVADHTE